MIKIKKEIKKYPGVIFITPPGLSKKEEKAYTRNLIKKYDESGKHLRCFKKEGTELINKLLKTIDEVEKVDLEDSIFVMRQAEYIVASWLDAINPHVKYKISK